MWKKTYIYKKKKPNTVFSALQGPLKKLLSKTIVSFLRCNALYNDHFCCKQSGVLLCRHWGGLCVALLDCVCFFFKTLYITHVEATEVTSSVVSATYVIPPLMWPTVQIMISQSSVHQRWERKWHHYDLCHPMSITSQ